MKKALAILAAMGIAGSASASILIPSLNTPVTQDFLSWAGTSAPTDWTMTGTTGPLFQGQGTGSGTAGGFWSFGAASSTERALGYLPNSSTAQTAVFTATYQNTTGSSVSQIDLSFDAEQWRNPGAGALVNTWALSYSTDGSIFTSLTYSPTWSSIASGTAGAVDGNSATYSETLAASITGLNLANNANFYLRWSSDRGVTTGASPGIAIDNVSVTVIPEPATIGLLGMIGGAALLRRRMKIKR